MKMNNKSRIIAALGALGCLALPVGYAQISGAAQSNQHWLPGMQGTQAMRVADSSNLPGENVNDLVGKKITSAQQQELGTVKDFLLHARSGRIAFIVVA